MDERLTELEQTASLSGLLGWLNFSDGRPDPRWQKQLNDAYSFLAERGEAAPWQALLDALTAGLRNLHATAAAFRDVRQAEAALALAGRVLPAYRCITPTCWPIWTIATCLRRSSWSGFSRPCWPRASRSKTTRKPSPP